MSISTYFNATIRNTGIKELSKTVDALVGRHLLIRDHGRNFHDPMKVYICEEPEESSRYMSSYDCLPYGRYSFVDPISPQICFNIRISPDVAPGAGISAGNKIEISDFTNNPYSKDEFSLLKDICYHMGYCSYDIYGEYDGKIESKEYESNSVVYFREMDQSLVHIAQTVSKVLLKMIKEDDLIVDTSTLSEVDNVYDHLVKERQTPDSEHPYIDKDYQFLDERAIVKGFYLTGLDTKGYINAIKDAAPYNDKNFYERIGRALENYEKHKEAYESDLEEGAER